MIKRTFFIVENEKGDDPWSSERGCSCSTGSVEAILVWWQSSILFGYVESSTTPLGKMDNGYRAVLRFHIRLFVLIELLKIWGAERQLKSMHDSFGHLSHLAPTRTIVFSSKAELLILLQSSAACLLVSDEQRNHWVIILDEDREPFPYPTQKR